MDHYQDITVVPDPEFPSPMLMNALFAKLHRALVQYGHNKIGVSFPQVETDKPSLGNLLRLHGSPSSLQALQSQIWLRGMRDHTELSGIDPVPAMVQYRRVRRVQVKSNVERIRRRYCKRHGVTEQEAIILIPDSVEKRAKLPYLQLNSQSTGQSFRLFVEHLPTQAHAEAGQFTSYGLSTTATIPWF